MADFSVLSTVIIWIKRLSSISLFCLLSVLALVKQRIVVFIKHRFISVELSLFFYRNRPTRKKKYGKINDRRQLGRIATTLAELENW